MRWVGRRAVVRGRKRGRRPGKNHKGGEIRMVRLEKVDGWLWMLLGVYYASREVVGRQVREYNIYTLVTLNYPAA